MERFAGYLQSPQAPGPQMKPNQLTLKSVILIPSLHYQTSPIATIPPSSFADLFNTHLLQPILTIQAFLPLLTSRLCPIGEKWVPPKVLVFTPSIISSINPPFHAPEATVCSALSAFTEVLTDDKGLCGHTFRTGNSAALARAVIKSLAEPRDKRLTRGRELAGRYDWSVIGPQVLAMYGLAGENRRAADAAARRRGLRPIT